MIKRDVCDELFSKLVRCRTNWTCEACGKVFAEGATGGLDCSHFFGRRYKGTRWHPDNAFAHCFGCHSKLGGDPYMFMKWVSDRIGPGMIEVLREKAYAVTKMKPADKEDLKRHLRAEWKRMQALRASGETGRIEFEAWQ